MSETLEGALERSPLAKGVLANRLDLGAAAQLLHASGFDRVELETPGLGYEPRASCKCSACAALWVASKAGTVMRIGLSTSTGRPEQSWFPGRREARAIHHVHDGHALGGGSFLLLGQDDGTLDIVSDPHGEWTRQPPEKRGHASGVSFDLDSWWAAGGEIPVAQGFARLAVPGYAVGVTAIAVLPRPAMPDTLDILVATRFPWLYVIEAASGRIRCRQRLVMPGWIQWILGSPERDRISCISRGGDILRFTHRELLEGGHGDLTELSLLPTAAMQLGDDRLLVGTTTGLFMLSDDRPEGVALPVTQSPVLCLDHVVVGSDEYRREYVAMGLEDGRLRVINADLLRSLASGSPRPEAHDHSVTLDIGAAVLAVETLRPDPWQSDAVYMLAVLRDHSLRLFHVTSERHVRARAASLWRRYFSDMAEPSDGAASVTLELAAARQTPRDCDPDAWKCLLIDVVLPRLRDLAPTGSPTHRGIVALACETAAGADPSVLDRLSLAMGLLAGDDVGLLLELSRSVLRAVRHRRDPRWSALLGSHMRELNACARRSDGHGRARLVAWQRFVRKYVLLGDTFAARRFGLLELVDQAHDTRNYLDALIYQTRLSQRRYDLRWETVVGSDVTDVHVVDCGAGRTLVVAPTVDGKVVVLDGASGRRLAIRGGPYIDDVLAPFDQHGPVRTLACTVALDDDVLRIVLSCSGAAIPSPGLAVCDVRWSGLDAGTVELVSVFAVACAAPVHVHALQPLPGRPDAFVAGLETRASPVGLVDLRAGRWTLELAYGRAATDHAGPEGSSLPGEWQLAPGRLPTRALAVIAVDDRASRYLVVAGSDDGLVCAASFAWPDPARDWKVDRWDRLTDAITSVALGRHRSPLPFDPDSSLFSCYLGTTAGDIFALSITLRPPPGGRTAESSFGGYDVQPLWRDSHDEPILAVQLWRTPLFLSDERLPDTVLAVATEPGRLCIYNHSSNTGTRVSASFNYYFRGMRFDRVAMPDRSSALTMVADGRDFVAAGPGGRLYMGKLVYLRESIDRADPERRDARREDARPNKLPDEMWARLHQLFSGSGDDEPFDVEPADRNRLKLELCELIRLEGEPLMAYALRERLSFQDPWYMLDADELTGKAHRLLGPLDPENPDDAQQIRIILETLCRAYLYLDPSGLAAKLLTRGARPDRHAETAATCEVVATYLMRGIAASTRAAARLRAVAIKELLRVPVLRHMACDDSDGERARSAVASAIDSCLRDDDRLVRHEALRAVSITLRNVGIMADLAGRERGHLLAAVFPDGLGSLEWLLDPIIVSLLQFPSLGRRAVLVSGAWHHISALLPLFQIFPDRSLALCDYLIRFGLDIDVIAMCARSLQGRRTAAIRRRLEHFYVLPTHGRDDFIERYDRSHPFHRVILEEMALAPRPSPAVRSAGHEAAWYAIDDDAMAHRLTELLEQLARMWNVRSPDEIEGIRGLGAGTPAGSSPGARAPRAPLAALECVVRELASIADALATPQVPEDLTFEPLAFEWLVQARERYGSSVELTAPVREIVSGIVAAWLDLFAPAPAQPGLRVAGYVLGHRISDDELGSVFELDAPRDLKQRCVITVLRRWNDARRFLEGARFQLQLCEASSDGKHIVGLIEILISGPHRAYVTRRYSGALEQYLTSEFHQRPEAFAWAAKVAEHIGRALRATHEVGRWHGGVKPANIFVDSVDHDPRFLLGGFDKSATSDDATAGRAARLGYVPEALSWKYSSDDALRHRQWEDIIALALILYRMVTGTAIDPRATHDVQEHADTLRGLASKPAVELHPAARRVIEALICIFEPGFPAPDIGEFLSWIATPRHVRIADDGRDTAGEADDEP